MAKPMPMLAPVTNAALPSSLTSMTYPITLNGPESAPKSGCPPG
jgi:hypothetical protein